jgi:hypothetical protein
MLNVGSQSKGTARTVNLKAYENDVLHALSLVDGADGLPGQNAENAIYIIRRRASVGCPPGRGPTPVPGSAYPYSRNPSSNSPRLIQPANFENGRSQPGYASADDGYGSSSMDGHSWMLPPEPPVTGPASIQGHSLGGHSQYSDSYPPLCPPAGPSPDTSWAMMLQNFDPTIDNPNVIRIPIKLAPGECPHITEDQITLHDGDIVFIESRETEVFYTGGLLGGGQYTLPRDYDIGILEAISIAEGRVAGGNSFSRSIGGISALNQDIAFSASRLAILRTLPNGKRIAIEVDLHKAMRYQEENIRVQPGDMLILEYTFPEAVCAFTQRFLLEGALIGIAASTFTGGGQ